MKRLLALLLVSACSSAPALTGARCPATDPPSYRSFGQAFFAAYCTGCHSHAAPDRYGAPPDLDFDTEPEIVAAATMIEIEAAAGPRSTNTDMPDLDGPVHAAPTDTERTELGRFLACERR